MNLLKRHYQEIHSSGVADTAAPHVPSRTQLTYGNFAQEYLLPHKPVVIADAIKNWRALTRWTPDFFKQRYPSKVFDIDGKNYALGELMDWVKRSSESDPAPYLRNQSIRQNFPELEEDISDLPYFQPNWLRDRFLSKKLQKFFNRSSEMEIYIGGAGRGFPVLHYDNLHTHAFLMQVYGQKKFYLFSPEDTPFMYAKPEQPNLSHLRDVENVDPKQYPLFSKAKKMALILRPGEMLFIPSGWWHTTVMLSGSISCSVNVANGTNWNSLARDLCARQALYKSLPRSMYLNGIRYKNLLLEKWT